MIMEVLSGHKLYKDLFNKLSDDSKKIILDLTINAMKGNSDSDYTNEMFISDLKKAKTLLLMNVIHLKWFLENHIVCNVVFYLHFHVC